MEPAQVVTFPHWPFVEGMSVPVGNGGSAEELVGGSGVGDGLGVGSGTASPQRPKSG